MFKERRRGIWKWIQIEIMLACIVPTLRSSCVVFGSGLFQEKAITPDESLSLAGTDWLIGNHSDELTPWIPVMAARQVISSSI